MNESAPKQEATGAQNSPATTPDWEVRLKDVIASSEPYLDPKKFQLNANAAQWTGHDGDPDEPHHYTHPGAPDRKFTHEDVEAAREATDAKPKPKRGRRRKVSEIVPGNSTEAPQSPQWKKFSAKEYVGVTPRTLESILHSPRDAQLFGVLISSIDPSMTGILDEALGKKKLSPDDREFLRYALYEFSKWLPRAEATANALSETDVELAARRSPKLESDTLMRGKGRVLELMKTQTLKLAMRDNARFQQLETTHNAFNKDRATSRYAIWNTRVRSVCDRVGIDARDYDKVFDTSRGNRAETRAALVERTRSKMNIFGRAVDFTFGTVGMSSADRAFKKADRLNLQTQEFWGSPTSWVLGRIDDNLKMITDVMVETISDNPDIQYALEQGAFTQRDLDKDLPEDRGAKTYAEADKKTAELTSKEAIVKQWDTYRAQQRNSDGKGWSEFSDEERTRHRDEWKPQEPVHETHGKGFWQCVVMAFVRALWSSPEMRKNLSLDKLPAKAA